MIRWYLSVVLLAGAMAATRAVAATPACRTPANTFDLIQQGIFEAHGCTRDFCHGSSQDAGLDLRAGVSYNNLVNHDEAAATDEPDTADDHEYALVAPQHPEQSLLWLVLAAKTLQRPNVPAEPMPIGAVPLTPDELEGVRLWIAAGAPARGVVRNVANLISACPQTAADDSTPLAPCDPQDTTLLLPELAPEPPQDIRLSIQDGHRVLGFSTVIANNGQGPLIIQAATRPTQPGQLVDAEQVIFRQNGSKCSHPAGAMRFTEDGQHWQYAQMANFELRKDDPLNGDVLALRTKTYYCLLDTDIIRAADPAPHQYQAHCTDDIGRMGISTGWKDTYHRVFPGQWLDLDADPDTPVPPGTYFLVNVANPTGALLETDANREDNTSYTTIRLTAPDPDTGASGPHEHAPRLPHPPHPPQSARSPHTPHAPHTAQPAHLPRSVHQPHLPGSAPAAGPHHETATAATP